MLVVSHSVYCLMSFAHACVPAGKLHQFSRLSRKTGLNFLRSFGAPPISLYYATAARRGSRPCAQCVFTFGECRSGARVVASARCARVRSEGTDDPRRNRAYSCLPRTAQHGRTAHIINGDSPMTSVANTVAMTTLAVHTVQHHIFYI